MSKKKYLLLFWLKSKNVAMEYVENLDVIRKLKRLYKHDRCEIVDLDGFGEEDLPEEKPEVKELKPHHTGWATKVRCVETGQVWRSVAECHRRTGYGFFQLNSACATGRELDGRHYEYYRENPVHPRLDGDGEKTE